MEIQIDLSKSAQDNANEYFYKSKKAKRKGEGAEQSIIELEHKLEAAKKRFESAEDKKKIKMIIKREWYEKFHWFRASNGMLVIGGRDAAQNELINSKYFEANDLFFHAEIFGASVTILKDGVNATKEVREEAAEFAACYSSAWKQGQGIVDVYCLKREQISKSSNKGSLGLGSFAMKGEREYFRGVKLELYAYTQEVEREGRKTVELRMAPASAIKRLDVKGAIKITTGSKKKSDAAKLIAKTLRYEDLDYVMQQLPAGEFQIKA